MIASIISREELENTFYARKLQEMSLTGIRAKWTSSRDIEGTLREIVLTFTMPYVPKQQKPKTMKKQEKG